MSHVFVAIVALAAMLFTTAAVQDPASLGSPEVHADRRVTFRIAAPKASEVTFQGDWHAGPRQMTRSAAGPWSITLGPLAPGTYIYSFTVDGVAMADPVNPRVKLRYAGSGSFFDVPADAPGLADARAVPHGTVALTWPSSGGRHDNRPLWIYTPPGYGQENNRRYPVLYLLHGGNDRPAGWIDVGHVNFIADNLIAEKKMVPMVLVMPGTHMSPPFPGNRANLTEFMEYQRKNSRAFETYLADDVMPYVAAHYRVESGRKHRAVAGFSMGGGMALRLFFNRLDDFASVGAFSAAPYDGLQAEHAALLTEPDKTNARIDLLWIGCGRQDQGFIGGQTLFATSQALAQQLARHRIRHTWHPTDGAHNYAMWRQHLVEFLPRVFQSQQVDPGK